MRNVHISRRDLGTIFIDITIFLFFGLLIGILIDILIPNVMVNEPPAISVLLLLMQVYISAVLIYMVIVLHEQIFRRDSDQYIGSTVFILVTFIAQIQIFNRVALLISRITGGTTVNHHIFA